MSDNTYDNLVARVKGAAHALSYPAEHAWDYQPENDDYEDDYDFNEFSASDYIDGYVYDIEYAVSGDGSYLGARLLIGGGGPTLWVNTRYRNVEGSWGHDEFSWSYTDTLGLDDWCEEDFESVKRNW